jgi:hypothetical protein
MKRFVPRLTYANVVATVALFLALGGSAIAAKHYLITSTSQIAPPVLKKIRGASGSPGALGAQGAPGVHGEPGTHGDTGTVAIGPWNYVGPSGAIPFGETFSNTDAQLPVRFRSEGDVVRLEGQFGSSQSGMWSSFPKRLVMTLPEGFRPKAGLSLAISPQSTQKGGDLIIEPDGTCYVIGEASGWGQLGAVTFPTS